MKSISVCGRHHVELIAKFKDKDLADQIKVLAETENFRRGGREKKS